MVTDGGPENSASEINKLNLRKQLRLRMKVALKDINFSNSIVEAVNKILKNSFFLQLLYKLFSKISAQSRSSSKTIFRLASTP